MQSKRVITVLSAQSQKLSEHSRCSPTSKASTQNPQNPEPRTQNLEPRTHSVKLTIIIPTLNEAARLPATLAGLGRPDDVEIIVADGGSTDATPQIARLAGARIVSSKPGKAFQMNRAAGKARGRFLLFLHADTRLPEGHLAEIETILTRPGVTAGAFRFQIDTPGWGFRLIEGVTNLRARFLSTPYGDQGLFVRASTLRRMGGFREIPIMEDFELVRRLARSGKVVISRLPAITAGRRWKRLGLVRTTLLNWTIVLAYWCGVSPVRLAGWYRCRPASGPKTANSEPVARNPEPRT